MLGVFFLKKKNQTKLVDTQEGGFSCLALCYMCPFISWNKKTYAETVNMIICCHRENNTDDNFRERRKIMNFIFWHHFT